MAASPRRIRNFDSPTSSESGSSSTSEEERLRRLFLSCDADGDGLLDRNDFAYMCRELNMEGMTQEIMKQLGMEPTTKISFADFIRFRTQVMREADQSAAIFTDTTALMSDQIQHVNNVTSWPTMSSDSLGAISGHPESLDYDSGARDLQSPEPPISLQKIIESHDPNILRQVRESCPKAGELMGLVDRLHLAAQTSLKGEIIELRSRLQHCSLERDTLEKQVSKDQREQCQLQEEYEDRMEELTFRFEERITELHSVIAELRKKIERHQINVIREEDEDDIDPAVSTKSQDGGSINDNTIGSQTLAQDGTGDLNSELSRVVTELETAIHERRRNTHDVVDTASEEVLGGEDDSVEEKALEVCKHMEDFSFEPCLEPDSVGARGLRPATFHPPPPPPPNEFPDPGYLQEEITALRTENSTLQEQIMKQEVDLQRFRLALSNLTEERNKLKKQAQDLPNRHHNYEGSASPLNSRTSTPTKHASATGHVVERGTPVTAADQFPIAKVAELKKLKTVSSERQVLGSHLSSIGMPTTKVAEHLVQGLWEGSKMQEIVSTVDQSGSSMLESKVPEFEIELERLQSQIDNLRSQNDVTNLTLEESKAQCDRLTVLIGKYESNVTALQIVLNYSDQCMELYEILCALLESEMGLVLANCRAAGLGHMGSDLYHDDQGEIASILQRAHHSRRAAENVGKHLLHKLDKSFGVVTDRSSPTRPWDDLSSSAGKTTASTSSSSGDTEFTKTDERRLRDYIHQLKSEKSGVKLTVMELESVHTDPLGDRVWRGPDAQRLDLENAVIIQELMAMKEEKADLKAQNYLLEKEKRALELRLNGKESQEQAYLTQIEQLKSEVNEQSQGSDKDESDTSTPSIPLAEQRSHDPSEVLRDLTNALRREKKLKSRVHELVSALEKLSQNSEIRHQQSAEFVNDLKRANSALISAFDKAKKKYQSKLKKLESQMQSLTERYETQIRMLKQRITRQEEAKQRPSNETSL